MAEYFQYHIVPLIELVFDSDVIDKIFFQRIGRIIVGRITPAYDDTYSIVEKLLGQLVRIIRTCRSIGFSFTIDSEAKINIFQVITRPFVQLVLQKLVERISREQVSLRSTRTRIGIIHQ